MVKVLKTLGVFQIQAGAADTVGNNTAAPAAT
jgi:hypothetical protein